MCVTLSWQCDQITAPWKRYVKKLKNNSNDRSTNETIRPLQSNQSVEKGARNWEKAILLQNNNKTTHTHTLNEAHRKCMKGKRTWALFGNANEQQQQQQPHRWRWWRRQSSRKKRAHNSWITLNAPGIILFFCSCMLMNDDVMSNDQSEQRFCFTFSFHSLSRGVRYFRCVTNFVSARDVSMLLGFTMKISMWL